jgi:hypothetical protein
MPILTKGKIQNVHILRTVHGKDWTSIANSNSTTAFQAIDSSGGPPEVEMHPQVTAYVAFQDFPVPGIAADVALEKIIETVAHTLPRFEEFFV